MNIYIQELEKIPKSEWAAIYCSLNRWKIPSQLIHLKPNWWPEVITEINCTEVKIFIMELMAHIQKNIPDEILSREWNKESMTEEEHKHWYNLSEKEKFSFNEPNNNNPLP